MSGGTNLNPHIFREFSIRGIADQDLPDEVVVQIGQAIGTFFKRRSGQTLVVGRDVRTSSLRISRSLIAGLLQTGLDVTDVGVVPTPVHNFATDFCAADGGVMVTASHNPPEHNGLKIRTDQTLYGDELHEIYRIASENYPQCSQSSPINEGQLEQADLLPPYLESVRARARIPSPLRLVVDGGNGTNGLIVSHLLRDLGCEVIELYCEPDGSFPNREPDPTAPGATADLSVSVRSEGADLGLAYDGDGDRLALVDERGNAVLGDQIMMILARDMLRQGPAKIVYEILCSQALADDIIAHGGEPVMTPSGYAFVHQAIRDAGAALGGELSGHLFFNEPDFRFDDAILGTVKLISIVSQSQRALSTLVAELPAYHSSPELRVACPDAAKASVIERVRAEFDGYYKVDTLDGARIHFDDGWALVRQSNTQPVISMRFEARSEAGLDAIQTKVGSLVQSFIGQIEEA
jgi:phosphomannomutase/phosphoglucomutase